MEDKHRTLVAMLRALGNLQVPVHVMPTDPGEIRCAGTWSDLREGRVLHERVWS